MNTDDLKFSDEIDDTERKSVNPKIHIVNRLGRVNRQNKIIYLNSLEEMPVRLKRRISDFGIRDNRNQEQ